MAIKSINTSVEWAIRSLGMKLEEFVGDLIPLDQMREYQRIARIQHLYIEALRHGWDEFDWQRASREGWLCEDDYTTYSKELNGLTYEEGTAGYLRHKGQS